MTRSWTDMARTALEAGRRWRHGAGRGRADDAAPRLSAADVIVLSLLLDLEEVDSLVCRDGTLRTALEPVLQLENRGRALRLIEAPDGRSHLRLLAASEIAAEPDAGATLVLHGVGHGFALKDFPAAAQGFSLRPLSSAGPALWQCGLALAVPEGGAAKARSLVEKLARSMHGDWIDPLALYERVQQLSGRLKELGKVDARDPEATADRITELEHELASLKRAALVSQHLLLVEAVEQSRGES
jgi:hypothetical protein